MSPLLDFSSFLGRAVCSKRSGSALMTGDDGFTSVITGPVGVGGGDLAEDFLDLCFGGKAGGTLELEEEEEITELGECKGEGILEDR